MRLYGVAEERGVVTLLALGILLLLSVILWLEVVLDGPLVATGVLALEVEVHEEGEAEGHAGSRQKGGMAWNETWRILGEVDEGSNGTTEVTAKLMVS